MFSQEEGLWVDTTKTFVGDDGETLYEEIDPWATMNDQDTQLTALRSELAQARQERDEAYRRNGELGVALVNEQRELDEARADRESENDRLVQLHAENRALQRALNRMGDKAANGFNQPIAGDYPTVPLTAAEAARVAALEAVAKAAKMLEAKLKTVHANTEYQGVWTVAQIHRGEYRGPTYSMEHLALVTALASLEAGDA